MKNKKIPLRCCTETKERLEKKDLLRIVKTKEGKIFIDDTLKANGRGCYIKKDIDVILKAKKSKSIDRSLGIEVPNEIYTELENKL